MVLCIVSGLLRAKFFCEHVFLSILIKIIFIMFKTKFVSVRLGATIFLFLGLALQASAAITTNTSSSLTRPNQKINASSNAAAVIGLNLVSSAETFTSIAISFNASAGFVDSDLATLSTATSSGVSLYRDNKSGGALGTFDSTDTVVVLSGAPTWSGATTTLTFASPETVPVNDTGSNSGDDYFVAIRTSSGATDGHAASFNLYPGQVGYSANTPAATPTTLTTDVITIDTVAPTVQTTGPSNNATGVPISTFINGSFSENMDFSTLSSTNIGLSTGGSPVGTSINSFPMGFNMVISNPPTFVPSSIFAKVATTTSGFFMISPGQPVMPQGGDYSVPVAGDIVYFQHDTFPAEIGLVTNATLTGGVFSINNFPLMGGQSLVKFSTPAATGLVTAATVVNTGDIIVANTSANPTSDRYNWHIVTTGAAVNGAGLRLDGATSAPTFNAATTTRFSTITPNASSTINGSSQLVATTTFSVGDMVFAKITANADNLNSYAWHVVTTGEVVLGGVAPSLLRLDGGTGAPTFAPSGALAILFPGVQGQTSETTTNISIGHILFTKTSANAGINDSYAFHMVSSGNGGVGGVASSDIRFDNSSANLNTGSTYTLTIGTGVRDSAGNPLAATSTIVFSTGLTGSTNNTPPFVQSTVPNPGNQSFSPSAPLKVGFSVDMATSGAGSATSSANVGLYVNNFGALGAQVSTTNTYDSPTRTITLAHATLSVSTEYILVVETTTTSSTGAPITQEYRASFRTADAIDVTAPTVMGSYPQSGATSVNRSSIPGVGFSEDMDSSTITGTTITLRQTSGGTPVSGTVSYNAQGRGAMFAPTEQLLANTQYTLTVASSSLGVKDLAGNALAADYVSTFTTDNVTDIIAPAVSFSNADNFGIAITFSEPMRQAGGPNAADNISNYTLESPVGSSISLGGKTVSYDPGSKTAKISGLSLQNGNSFRLVVSTQVQDLAGNGMDSTGTPAKNAAFGTVANSDITGGQLGPNSGATNDPGMQGMNPIRVSPMVRQAGAVSDYHVEFLASTTIPATGQIVLTFPSGFDVTNAVAATAGTQSFCNSDINGPMSGTVTLGTITNDANAGTITIDTAGSGTGANSFLCLDLAGIVNSTIPSATGYTVDIKTKDTAANNRALLETKTSAPFSLGQTGTNTLTVQVFHDDVVVNGNLDNGEGIGSVGVFFFSPASGGQATTTAASGVATFSNVADGDYQIGLQPGTVSSYSFNSAPQSINIAGNTTKKFVLSAAPRTITGTVYGPANTKVDVFASSPNGFAKTTVTTNSTSGTTGGTAYGGSVSYSLGVQNNTTYQIGVGPNMPEGSLIPGATPVMPTFNFMPPQPVAVTIVTSNISGQNFVLVSASNSIVGSVKDSTDTAVSNAGVFCRPVQNSSTGSASGAGTGGQTGTDGAFALNTVPGVYICGAFKPGMPSVPDKQVSIATDGTQTPSSLLFTLGASASSLTITGTIKDDGGNAVPYAGVSGRKVTSTSDTTALGGGTSNFVGGPADSNGAYTLYVTAGTWVVEAFAPGLGRLGSKTITVGSANVTGQDFSAQTLSMGTITGTSTLASVGVQGVMVRAETADGSNNNMTTTAADGTYSLKVPAGTYSVKCFFPGIGESAPLTEIVVSSDTTTADHDCSVAAPITVTVRVTDGTNAITNAFVDVRDSNGRGNGTNVGTASSTYGIYTVAVPPGTYSVRVGHPAYGQIGTTQTATTTQTITVTATSGATFAVTGGVAVGGTPLSGAWVSLTGTPSGQSNLISIGGQTSTVGTFSIDAPAGSYKLRANKPGYKSPAESTITITASTAVGTTTLTAASKTISGTVTIASVGVAGAFVDANDGNGGFAVSQTDSSGAYSLAVDSGTWAVRAHSQGYEAGPTSVVVAGSNATQNLALSAISGFVVKPERQENITPTSGGLLTNTDIGAGFKLNIPANALGTSANAGTVKTQSNTAMPTPSSGTILSKNAVTITASDSSGQPIKNLNDNVTIVVPYTAADVPDGQEGNLVLGVWNDATQSYDTLPTTVDTVNNTLTAIVTHFSDFAPLLSSNTTNGTVAATPAATPSVSSGGSSGGGYPVTPVVVASTTAANNSSTTPTVFTTTSSKSATLTPIAISPYTRSISLGFEGADVIELQTFLESKGFLVMPKGVAKGYFGQITKKALASYQKSVGLPPVGLFGPQTRARVEKENSNTTQSVVASEVVSAATYKRSLRLGSEGNDVAMLQTFLEKSGFLEIPSGLAKGYFGQLTKTALIEYQRSVGLPPVGLFGPQTRAKVIAESKNSVTVSVPVAEFTYERDLEFGSSGSDVATLQAFLESKGFLVIPKGVARGYFGGLTRSALASYQKSVGVSVGGVLDVETRSHLNSLK